MIKKIGISILVIISILLVTIIFLLTPLGLRTVMDIGVKFLPGTVQYKKVSGLILGPIDVKDLTYRYENTVVTIKKLHWEWRLFSILKNKIHITNLKLTDVAVNTKNQQESINWEKLSSQWKSFINNPKFHQLIADQSIHFQKKAEAFKLPINIEIDQARINHIKFFNVENQLLLELNNIKLSGNIKTDTLNVQLQLDMSHPYSSHTSLDIKGDFSHYFINAHSNNQYVNWQLHGDGNWQHINLNIHSNNMLEGNINGKLAIEWSPTIQWNIQLFLRDLNAKLLNEHWPEKFNCQIRSRGQLENGEPVFSLESDYKTPNMQFSINGDYAKRLAFYWRLNINDLSELLSDYDGSLQSKGTLQGTLKAIYTTGMLKGQSLSAFGYQANSLNGDWSIDLSDHANSKIHMNATQLTGPYFMAKQLTLNLFGTLAHHEIIAKITNEQASMHFNIKGGLQDSNYLGTIQNFSIHAKNSPSWHLSSPVKFSASNHEANLSNACFSSTSRGSICMQGNWSKTQAWKFFATGEHINLSLLSNFLISHLKVIGEARLKISAHGDGKSFKNAAWEINSNNGKINYLYNNRWLDNHYQRANFSGSFDGKNASSQFSLYFTDKNYINANVHLPNINFSDFSSKTQSLKGNITAQLSDLKMLSAISPDMVIPSGFLSSNINISGTLHSPSLNGAIKLSQGHLNFPKLGIKMSDINFNIKADKKLLIYQGSALSVKNKIKITGKTNLSDTFKTKLHLTGNHILVFNTLEYLVYASPDITISIDNKKIDIKGIVDIPKAKLAPVNFTNVVTLPSDEVEFVGKKIIEKETPWEFSLNLHVKLGNDVTINTYGAKGRLKGHLKILSKPKQALLGTGKIFIKDGMFDNYGITLNIDPNSNINYINAPLSNPNLYLRASKKVNVVSSSVISQLVQEKYVVGVQVEGNAKNPIITFYSIPANLSQVNILSLLATGSLVSTGSVNTALLISTISALKGGAKGLGKAGGFITSIRKGLGLSEFGVETTQTTLGTTGQAIGQQTSFVIGKQLTKNLYLRYSYGLNATGFININQFTIRYVLHRNWAIQSYSNTLGSGIDVLYTLQVK